MLISGQLARMIFRLTRFSTLKEENKLALRYQQNKQRSLLDLGVDKIFCLNNHLEYLSSEVPGLSQDDIKIFFDRPFREAIEYVRHLDRNSKWSPSEKMDCIEKISRSMISEIDDYYAKADD